MGIIGVFIVAGVGAILGVLLGYELGKDSMADHVPYERYNRKDLQYLKETIKVTELMAAYGEALITIFKLEGGTKTVNKMESIAFIIEKANKRYEDAVANKFI